MFKIMTTTGGRPEAWELCKRWMNNQVWKPDLWIIVDDCPEPSDLTGIQIPHVLVRPQPFWRPGDNTQARNLLAGMVHVKLTDRLAIIEDDDYYAPEYLKAVDRWLVRADLVGESRSLYYHVVQRVYKDCGNTGHASLCSTGMRGNALAEFVRACKTRPKFIDMNLWRAFRGTKYLQSGKLVTGMKGLPGREGIGMGHRMKGHLDPDLDYLFRRIGADARAYEEFVNGSSIAGF